MADETSPWIVGVFGRSPAAHQLPDSYASGFPHGQDLFLWNTVEVDELGTVVTNEDGSARLTGAAVLVRWDEVTYAEFIADPEG